MGMFEYTADMRDLALDGRHWRAQFGGSSGAGPKMGGYVCCGPTMYVLFRLVMAAAVITIFPLDVAIEREHGYSSGWFLLIEHWTLLVALIYFTLAFLITLTAVLTSGIEAESTPPFVLLCWMCYGILVPASLGCMLMWVFVTQRAGEWTLSNSEEPGSSILTTLVLWALVYLDLYVNRQPYYASFHGFCGIIFCWTYVLFNYLFCVGKDNEVYIYRQLNWRQYMSAGKLVMLQLFLLLPYFNALYWGVVWARRRARVAAKLGAV